MDDFDPRAEFRNLRRIYEKSEMEAVFEHLEKLDRMHLQVLVSHAAIATPSGPPRPSAHPTYPDSEMGRLVDLFVEAGYEAVRNRIDELTLSEVREVFAYTILCRAIEKGP